MDKSIINRISELEKLFPLYNFNVEEHINSTIELIENILGYEVKDRIKLPKYKYMSENVLDKEIFRCLSVNELRELAYSQNNKNELINK